MKKVLQLALVFALLSATGAVSQDAADEQTDESAEKAKSILESAAAYIAEQDSLSVTADILYRFVLDKSREEMTSVYTLAFQRPKTIALSLVSPDMDLQVISDGSERTLFLPAFGQYRIESVSELESDPPEVVKSAGVGSIEPLVDLLAEFVKPVPYVDILKNMTDASYKGEEPIGDVPCHRIGFMHEELNWDIWVRTGNEPLVMRVAPDLSEMVADAKQDGIEAEFTIVMELSKWKLGDIGKESLTFSPPDDAKEVAFFSQPQPADLLVGKVAPELTLNLLGGGKLDTVASRGKEIVILDFWATWCGPCRIAMPILDKVASKFKDDDVRLYAVNLGEEPAYIRSFLDDLGLGLTVALDVDGSAGKEYKVDGIPQTVIIDRSGDVRYVHVGIPPPDLFEATLAEQLETLVKEGKTAGGSNAKEAPTP